MNCQDARESLSTLLDGDIGLTERVPLELHVNMCGECRQRLVELQRLREIPRRPPPRPVHWRPLLAAGMVGRALEAFRPEDVVTRVRRFVAARIPSRHLAVAAAVPLALTLAIFLFERGFTIGAAMRQRAPSAPAAMRSSPPASPAPAVPGPAIPSQGTPAAAPSAHSGSPPPPAARALVAPSPVTPPVEKVQVAEGKGSETKAVGTGSASRSQKPESTAKREQVAAVAAAKPATTRSAAVSASGAAGEPSREAAAVKSLAAERPVPPKSGGATAVSTASAPSNRRASVDVVGRLQVKSRSEAERNLAALFTHAGAASVSRQRGPAATVMEAAVPRAKYGQFAQDLARIGSWRVEAERSPLPDLVQVTVRLAE